MNEISQVLISHSEAVLFFAILAEQIGLPFPAAPLLVAAGALSADGSRSPFTALGVTVIGCLLADWMWFFLGRRGGKALLQRVCVLLLAEGSWSERADRFFDRHGVAAVISSKFFPGLSLIIPPLAGASGIGATKFLIFDVLGSLLYAAFYLALGLLFSKEVNGLLELLEQLGGGAAALACLVILIGVGCLYWKRRKVAGSKSSQSVPRKPERRRILC